MKVLAGGRFNVIHPGHIYFLKRAKSLGDELVVVIASDRTVRKSGRKLLNRERDRKAMVESLRFVDRAIVGYPLGDEVGYERILRREKPGIIALGHDQKIGKDIARRYKTVRIGRLRGYKTSSLLDSIF